MDVELVSCLFELPPSDRSISRSFNCRYDICWICIEAMNGSYFCGNALRTMAIFRFLLIFLYADCSLNTRLFTLFGNSIIDSPFFLSSRNFCQSTMIWFVRICPNVSSQIFPYINSSPVILSNDHLQSSIMDVHNDFLIQLPLNIISVGFINFFIFYILHLGFYLQYKFTKFSFTKFSGFFF